MIERDYYRKIDREQAARQVAGRGRHVAHDQFSHLLLARGLHGRSRSDTQGQFEGVGMTVDRGQAGPERQPVYEGSPAQRGGIKPGT